MTRYILDGQIIQHDAPFTINGIYHPAGPKGYSPAERLALGLVEIIEQPRPDDRLAYVSEDPSIPGAWIVTPMAPEQVKAKLMAHAASRRWMLETGGIEVGGMAVPTDERTQAVLTGARAKILADPAFEISRWKVGAGQYVTLDAVTIVGLSDAVAAHVQACFDLNAQVDELISTGAITTFEEVDQAMASLPEPSPAEPG